jgi:ribosomal protein L12E/L44/L45/RPP1/RPP2
MTPVGALPKGPTEEEIKEREKAAVAKALAEVEQKRVAEEKAVKEKKKAEKEAKRQREEEKEREKGMHSSY